MRILTVITDLEEVRKILRHLDKVGRSPPGLGAPGWIQTSCNPYPVSLPAAGGEHVLAAFLILPKKPWFSFWVIDAVARRACCQGICSGRPKMIRRVA